MKLNLIQHLAPRELCASPFNPRRDFDQHPDWPDFVENIRANGVQVPLLARTITPPRGQPYPEIVAGHRRWVAATAAKLATVPVILETMTDAQAREAQAIENLQRADLSPLEEARGYANWRDQLIKDNEQPNVEQAVSYIASKVGKKRSAIFQKLSLLKAAKPVQDAIASGRLEPSAAALIATIPTPEAQAKCLKEAGHASVRDLAEHIEEGYRVSLDGAPFDRQDATLVPLQRNSVHDPEPRRLGGACTDCPHRSGNMAGRLPELAKKPNICTLPACFAAKKQAHADRILNRAKLEKRPVVDAKYYHDLHYEFETAAEHHWRMPPGKTWGQLAAKANLPGSITVNDRGQRIEVFNRTQQDAILKANKIETNSGGLSKREKAEQKKRQEKEKRFKTIAGGATSQLLGRLIEGTVLALPAFPKVGLWAILAFAAKATVSADRVDFVAKRRGLSKSFNDSNGALEKWMKASGRTPVEFARLVLELIVCSNWNGGFWHETKWSKEFKALCELTGKTPEQLAKLDELVTLPPPGPKAPPRPPRNREVGKPQPKRKGRK